MKRIFPPALALIVAACAPMPATATGSLLIRNPLAGTFQTQVIPSGTERIAVLLADEQSRPIRSFSLGRSETTRIATGLPVGPVRVVVAAFGTVAPLAAIDATAVIEGGKTTQVVADLSTDPAVLARLGEFLALMADAPRPTPSPTPSAQPSAPAPSAPSQSLPSLAPLPSLMPFPGLSVDDAFSDPVPNPLWWETRLSGNPQPTMAGGGGLTITLSPGTVPAGGADILAEIETRVATELAVQAEMSFRTLSWPAQASGTRVGLFTKGASLVRDGDEYVLSGGGQRLTLPAPTPGGTERLRLIRQGQTLNGYAGTGAMTLVGQITVTTGNTPLIVGMRSDGRALSGRSAQVVIDRVGAKPVFGL